MTGHHVRTILSKSLDIMTNQTGSPDIMSVRLDLRKRLGSSTLDMMTGSLLRHMISAADLRKRGSRHGSVRFADIMSNPPQFVTARSGRRSR